MSQNPYQTPLAESNFTGDGAKREQLRSVARYQQWVIYALLVNIILNVLAMTVRTPDQPVVPLIIGVCAIGIAIFTAVAIFLLSRALGHPVSGAFRALLMFVPCISLIVLLMTNQQATTFLTQNGVKVGFMGANPDKI